MPRLATIFPDTRTPGFIGRDDEMATALATMRQEATRLLTVTGPAGVGKTRFAVELVRRLADDYADGVIVIDLATITSPDALDAELAREIGMRARWGARLASQVDAWLAPRKVLLVFDNAEHILGVGPRVAHCLTVGSSSQAIVTSRHRLNLSIENELYLDPLGVTRAPLECGDQTNAPLSPAGRLFLQMAGVEQSATVDSRTLAQVERVSAWLDGVPLAMELVAARLPELTPTELDAVMTHGDIGSAVATHEFDAALENAVDWSYRLLSPPARQLLRYLTVFVGGFSLELVERLVEHASLADLDGASVVDCLLELSDHHLILSIDDTRMDAPRFRMLMMVMETARHRLVDHGEKTDAQHALAHAIIDYAEQREFSGLRPKLEYQVGELNENFHNIVAALAWFHQRNDAAEMLRLVGALTWFWYAHGHYSEGQAWYERALELDVPREGMHWARFLTGYGVLLDVQGSFAEAHAVLEEALAAHKPTGRPEGLTSANLALGFCSLHLERYDDAERYLHDAIVLSRKVPATDLAETAEGLAWENLGANAHEQGRLAEADDALRRAIAIHQGAGFHWGEARALCDLGCLLRDRGDPHGALAACQAVLAPATKVKDSRLIAASFAGLATLLANDGQAMTAAWFWGTVDALRQVTGTPSFLKANLRAYDRSRRIAREALGDDGYGVAHRTGAQAPLSEALALAREISLHGGQAISLSPEIERDLTGRERDVFELLVQGTSTRAIGATLGITERTVSSHIGSLFRKHGVNSRLELIAMAAQAQR